MTETLFETLWLSQNLLASIQKKGYKTASPIQAGVIPLALNTNKDIVGQAQTGSGKTAAFGLPILEMIDQKSRNMQSLILTPTRELAIQIAQELESFTQNLNINIILLYGGQSIRNEISALKNSPHIIVWTPGRVTDHLQKGRINMDTLKYFVLDEADEMLNVGFREDIEQILQYAPVEKRVFLFSATMPPFIQSIIKNYMRDYETISIQKTQLTNDKIEQMYYEAPRNHKFDVLCRILDITPDFYGIIFCRTKAETDEVSSKLSGLGYLSEALHGDIEQSMREKVLNRFKKRYISILVATDVAARGIDVNDLTHVVNFELPDNPESYTHRIGRTGRAGKTGIAVSIVSSADLRKISFIERTIKTKITRKDLPSPVEVVAMKKIQLKNDVEMLLKDTDSLGQYGDIAKEILENNAPEMVVEALLKKFYKNAFDASTYKDLSVKSRAQSERSFSSRDDGMIRLFVAKGKNDNFSSPGKLLSFLANESGLGDLGAGKVDILSDFSYVDVPEAIGVTILRSFKEKNFDRPLVVRAKEKASFGGGRDRERRSNFRSRNDFGRWERGEKRVWKTDRERKRSFSR